MKEQEVLHTAIKNLPDDVGIQIIWEEKNVGRTDGQIRLTIKQKEVLFNAEVKKEIREHQLPNLDELAHTGIPLIVIAHYLRPKIKVELRKRNIAYLEMNGNIFINYENLYVLIDANKPTDLAKETGNRAFTKAGLKVVYLYLTNEEWLNQPHREIAKKTDIALGNITNVNHGLEKEKFLLKINKTERKLNDKKGLLDKWMKAYATTLQPALKLGQFRFANERNFIHYRELQLDENTWWGGEPAGDLLTDYLRPGELTMYTNNIRNELIKKYKLIPDPEGDIKVYNTFWDTTEQRNEKTVNPLLVYADLMNTGNSRCHETAKLIWEKHLAHEF